MNNLRFIHAEVNSFYLVESKVTNNTNHNSTTSKKVYMSSPEEGQWWPKAQEELEYLVSAVGKLHVT